MPLVVLLSDFQILSVVTINKTFGDLQQYPILVPPLHSFLFQNPLNYH